MGVFYTGKLERLILRLDHNLEMGCFGAEAVAGGLWHSLTHLDLSILNSNTSFTGSTALLNRIRELPNLVSLSLRLWGSDNRLMSPSEAISLAQAIPRRLTELTLDLNGNESGVTCRGLEAIALHLPKNLVKLTLEL